MNTTTHIAQKIHQNAKKTRFRRILINRTENIIQSNGCEAKKINRPKSGKTKRKHGVKRSVFCFVAVTSDEGANLSTILHNSCYMAKRTWSEAESI